MAGAKLAIKIKVRAQPAQSPDFNICDLALFRALKCAVRKLRREPGSGKFDVEQLVKDVLAAYGAYDAEKLEEMWKYKGYVMSAVARDGGNTYDRHRKRARSG